MARPTSDNRAPRTSATSDNRAPRTSDNRAPRTSDKRAPRTSDNRAPEERDPTRATAEERSLEVHVTVELNGGEPDALALFAKGRGARFVHIVLAAGAHASQPMLSWRQAPGVAQALERCAVIGRELEPMGMRVARVKVEAELGGDSEVEPRYFDVAPRYFEAHFKVELLTSQLGALGQLASQLGVHLSRNAYSRSGESEARFLTARHRERGEAQHLFDRVEKELADSGLGLVEVEREAVLHDSNLRLDEGWAT